MKITNVIGFFLVIFLPFLIIWVMQTNNQNEILFVNQKYDGAITTGVEDAAQALKHNANPKNEFSYASKKYSNLNYKEAYETFIKTVSTNFEIQDKLKIKELEYYTPLFGVIGYEGYTSNRFERIGETLMRVWQPQQPYTYVDASGNIIRFTLDDYVYVYDRYSFDSPQWNEGPRKQLINDGSLIPLLQNEEEFENKRRLTIVSTIEKSIETELNLHNRTLSSKNFTYKFHLPLITKETWYNTIDDVGIIAFIQGYPIEQLDMEYNQFGFAASRLIKNDTIHATTLATGQRVFWEDSCNLSYPKTESYSNKQQAAKNGYTEISCKNQ